MATLAIEIPVEAAEGALRLSQAEGAELAEQLGEDYPLIGLA
jgi:hypothetical protein